MKVLYDRRKKIVETFEYSINKGGPLNLFSEQTLSTSEQIASSWTVEIKFVNGEYSQVSVDVPEEVKNTRSYWRLMAAIEEEVKLLGNDSYRDKEYD